MFDVLIDDLTHPQSRDLIAFHLAGMAETVPEGAVFLDLSALRRPEVTVWSAWEAGCIAGIGALKALPDGGGEIKSMRTHPAFSGRGVGGLLLETMIAAARVRGYHRLSLETGSGPDFDAALRFYEKHGFRKGKAYAGYGQTAFNHFLHLAL